ncbi:hypothetical protein WA026_023782 [Henosepilachna vigintioctopunctata]|uniref:Uncharacterized protein n=1 Tax=Henosepilachna vigintioctopunctata TaxID=420089 RepID=A0AAW1V3Q2_9CUCU
MSHSTYLITTGDNIKLYHINDIRQSKANPMFKESQTSDVPIIENNPTVTNNVIPSVTNCNMKPYVESVSSPDSETPASSTSTSLNVTSKILEGHDTSSTSNNVTRSGRIVKVPCKLDL